ncbi:hypothetical protein PINS_up020893 [Pythium insidiosum]|nr:hypothetical protein PINS_up020893 [Pythium insidiosum]
MLDPVRPVAVEPQAPTEPTAGAPAQSLSLVPARPRTRRARGVVVVSSAVFVVCWTAVLLLHVINAVFVLCAAFVHLYLAQPAIHYNFSAVRISMTTLHLSGWSYLVVAIVHLEMAVSMLWRSIRLRMLTMDPTNDSIDGRTQRRLSISTTTSLPTSPTSSPSILKRVVVTIQRGWRRVVGPTGVLSISSPLFPVLHAVRELIEVTLQVYQLYHLSRSVSRRWINRLAVTTVVFNCFSIPVLSSLVKRSESSRRLALLASDMYLDFVCAVAIPVCIMLPYIVAFDYSRGAFPDHLLFNDVWFSNAVAEGRQVLVTSTMDYVSSLLPHYGIVTCLRVLKRLIRRAPLSRPSKSSGNAIVPSVPSAPMALPPPSHEHRRTSSLATVSSVASESLQRPEQIRAAVTRAWPLLYAMLLLLGVHVVVMHTLAERHAMRYPSPECRLMVAPWTATRWSCSVLHLDCARRQILGARDDIENVLASVERPILTKLVLRNCAALVIPHTLRLLAALRGVETVNSTLVDWPSTAGLASALHPFMVSVHFRDTNLSAASLGGLLHTDLPLNMATIGFMNSNISALPEDVGDLWAGRLTHRFKMEQTLIARLPASLGRLRVKHLWLTRNRLLRELPDDAFANASFERVWLSGSALQRLPQSIGQTLRLRELFVEHTDVLELPPWVQRWQQQQQHQNSAASASAAVSVQASLYGSPYCSRGDRDPTLCARDRGTAELSAHID